MKKKIDFMRAQFNGLKQRAKHASTNYAPQAIAVGLALASGSASAAPTVTPVDPLKMIPDAFASLTDVWNTSAAGMWALGILVTAGLIGLRFFKKGANAATS